jgi:hypothetical protein
LLHRLTPPYWRRREPDARKLKTLPRLRRPSAGDKSPFAGKSLKYLQADAPPGAARNIEADRQTLFATILDPTSEEVWQARAQVLKTLNRPSEAEEATARVSALQKPPK